MRSRLAVAAAIVASLLLPSGASAQVFLGLRAGYGVPLGEASSGVALKDWLSAQVPVTLDLGLRLGRSFAVGAYESYGVGLFPSARSDACAAAGQDCSAADLRVGAQANLIGTPSSSTELWAGLAVGYEELRTRVSGGGLPTAEESLKGYDATLQAGFDLLPSASVRVGPFASFTVGQFLKLSNGSETTIADQRLHGWAQVGLRILFAN